MGDDAWDVIIIGSGMGGLSCAAALSKLKHRVLVLEQDAEAGGLTRSFSREGWSWDAGVHYLGDLDEHGTARRLYDWLSDGRLKMHSLGTIYDTLHFPDGFEIQLSRPEEALCLDLKERFPDSAKEIDAFMAAMREAQHIGQTVFALRAMPEPVAKITRFLHRKALKRWCERTTQQVLDELILDPKLKAVLAAQWGDYGAPPGESCFAIHATVIREYFSGAFYPVGGASIFASELGKTIAAAGGRIEVNASVVELAMKEASVCGVVLSDRRQFAASHVVSNIGAHNIIAKLLSPDMQASAWAKAVLAFDVAPAFLSLFIGFEGDVQAAGATPSNHWIHETWDANEEVMHDPVQEDIRWFMVSFPSLKDPNHNAGSAGKHTGDMLFLVDWKIFSRWTDDTSEDASRAYQALKQQLTQKMLTALGRHFPRLLPLIKHTELSTPITMARYTGAYHGAAYGLKTTPQRFLSETLNAKTPVPGLYLSGQDVGTPGIQGAMWGGLMTAGAIDPRVFQHL